jgi:hypothetical protein
MGFDVWSMMSMEAEAGVSQCISMLTFASLLGEVGCDPAESLVVSLALPDG